MKTRSQSQIIEEFKQTLAINVERKIDEEYSENVHSFINNNF